MRRLILGLCALGVGLALAGEANAQEGYNQHYARTYNSMDWMRFYHYPYVYYPQNFWSADYFKSSDSLYYRYPPEMQIPAYNRRWHNELPQCKRYYHGHHFTLDIF